VRSENRTEPKNCSRDEVVCSGVACIQRHRGPWQWEISQMPYGGHESDEWRHAKCRMTPSIRRVSRSKAVSMLQLGIVDLRNSQQLTSSQQSVFTMPLFSTPSSSCRRHPCSPPHLLWLPSLPHLHPSRSCPSRLSSQH
jgi:hypothetical protein